MKINEILQKLNELLRKDMESGEKVDAKDFPEAIQKIYELYKQGKLNVYCPDVFEFRYTGEVFALCAVSGKKNKKDQIPYGIGHSLQKHTNQIVDGKEITEEMLIKAMKNTQSVLFNALNKRKILFNQRTNNILFEGNGFVYAVVIPKNNQEVCYLQTVFKADNNYMKRLKKSYK